MVNINPRPKILSTSKSKSKNTMPTSRLEEIPGEEGMMTDVIQILHEDHLKVLDLFFQFTCLADNKEKKQLVEEILQELYLHTTVEEELVYPKARKGGEDMEDMMDEAETEHHVSKVVMAELATMKPTDDLYDAKVTVLSELIRHHVREEEKEMFKKIEEAGLDVEAIGKQVLKRKEELKSTYSPDNVGEIWEELEEFKEE